MKAEIKDGDITVNLWDSLNSLSLKDKLRLVVTLGCMEDVFDVVSDQLIDGYTDPVQDGWSSGDRDMIERKRLRLLESLDAVRFETVKRLIGDRETAQGQAKRSSDYSCELERSWNYGCDECRDRVSGRPRRPEWFHAWVKDQEVKDEVAALDAELVEAAGGGEGE